VARGIRTVECIVASEVDQCQLCLVDMQEGVDNGMINPRRACAARVTVVVLCVCVH